MAGLTKEQRAAKQAEEQKRLEESIRASLEKEYQKKLEEEKSKLSANNKTENKVKTVASARTKIDIPTNAIIPVMSGVHGILTYSSKKTFGYTVDWDDYGAVEYVEYGELLSMRNTQRSFFEKNWIFIQDTDEYSAKDIYAALAVEKYYKNVIVGEDLDSLFTMTPDEIKETISTLSDGVKQNIASIAKGKIESGELDSINRIKALEESIGLDFSPSY